MEATPSITVHQLPARASDPDTSHAAAGMSRIRRGSMRYALALAYSKHPEGLTDEEAGMLASLDIRVGPWKRCSELRASGIIRDTGERALSSSGAQAMICVMPPAVVEAFGVFARLNFAP